MYRQVIDYCGQVAENVCLFLYHFLLSHRSYVIINIVIIAMNLILLRTVQHYMYKKRIRRHDSLRMFKSKVGRKFETKHVKNDKRYLVYAGYSSNIVRQKSTSLFGNNKNNKSVTTVSRVTKNLENVSVVYPNNCASPAAEFQPVTNKKKQPSCDETLDEITWGCDDSQSSLLNTEDIKQCDDVTMSTTAANLDDGVNSSQFNRQEQCSNPRRENTTKMLHLKQMEDKCRNKKKESDSDMATIRQQDKEKDIIVDTSSRKQIGTAKLRRVPGNVKQKCVSRDKTHTEQRYNKLHNEGGATEHEDVFHSKRQLEMSPSEVAVVAEDRVAPYRHCLKDKKKLFSSPLPAETGNTSGGESQNSNEQCDPEMGGSDQQFKGNRSESSLVCKRDSWIWFSPEMRPSVENFAARQRKFKSRDPRVAELAVEISRQEKMNRDIERAAESLIDSSSSSMGKHQEASVRAICKTGNKKRSCDVVKNKVRRKSRLTSSNIPDQISVASSMTPAICFVTDCHDNNNRTESSDDISIEKISPAPRLSTQGRRTCSENEDGTEHNLATTFQKRRQTGQINVNQQVKRRNHEPNCNELRTTIQTLSEHSKHGIHDQNPLVRTCLPPPTYWYNSPAATIIRNPRTTITSYSPMYDNTTLIPSRQCSASSLESNSQETTKVSNSNEKYHSTTTEVSDTSKERNGITGKQNVDTGSSTFINLVQSSGAINIHHEPAFKSQSRQTSPKQKKHSKQFIGNPTIKQDATEIYQDSLSCTPGGIKNKYSPPFRSSASLGIHSPSTRRCFDLPAGNSNRMLSENRYDGMKALKKSPQLALSTGESESDSVYKDKSAGLDSSYRQCLISKEVNTAVQRLLFDTEKSSSSHSRSSKSKIPVAEMNCNRGEYRHNDREENTNMASSQVIESSSFRDANCTPNSHLNDFVTDVHCDSQECDSDKGSLDVSSQPTLLNLSQTDSHSSGRKTSHKYTNIYARDYYLGKRVAMRRQQESKNKLNVSQCKNNNLIQSKCTPVGTCSSQNRCKSRGTKQAINKTTREASNSQHCLKSMSLTCWQSPQLRHSNIERNNTLECPTTTSGTISSDQVITVNSNEREINASDINWPDTNACKYQSSYTTDRENGDQIKVPSSDKLNTFYNSDTFSKKSRIRKSCSQNDRPILCGSLAAITVPPGRKNRAAHSTLSHSQAALSTLSHSQTAHSTLSHSQAAQSTLSHSQTAQSTLSQSQTAQSTLPNSQTAQSTLSHSQAAPSTLSRSQTTHYTLSHSHAAQSTLSNSQIAQSTLSPSQAAQSTLSHSQAAQSTLSHSQAAPSTLSHSQAAQSTLSHSQAAQSPYHTPRLHNPPYHIAETKVNHPRNCCSVDQPIIQLAIYLTAVTNQNILESRINQQRQMSFIL